MGFGFEKYPQHVKRLFVEALEGLFTAQGFSATARAHAAMTLSECHDYAIGCSFDNERTLHWLRLASWDGEEHPWYARVKDVISPIEPQALDVPPQTEETYLIDRIRAKSSDTIALLRSDSESVMLNSPANLSAAVFWFNDEEPDRLSRLHMAALLGDTTWLSGNLRMASLLSISRNGFSPLHYACLGGHLPTIRLLLDMGADTSARVIHGIAPLHLSIFTPEEVAIQTIDALRNHAAPLKAYATVEFSHHDILLEGDALRWAVLTRNRAVAQALSVGATEDSKRLALRAAFMQYFPEISADLASCTETPPYFKLPPVFIIQRPFGHWITHGRYSRCAIRRTFAVSEGTAGQTIGNPSSLL